MTSSLGNTGAEVPVMSGSEVTAFLTSEITCPVCACLLKETDVLHLCEQCETPHHKDCWDYTGGCAIFGCKKGVLRQYEESRRGQHQLTRRTFTLMNLWGRLLYFDFTLFLMGHYSSLIFLLNGILALSLLAVHLIALSVFKISLYGVFSPVATALFYIGAFSFGAFLLASAGYLFLVPPKILMRIHF